MAEYEVKQLKVSKDGNIYNINTGEDYAFEGTYNASTNKIATESTVSNAIGALAFEGTYNASTNKIATESTVSNAIGALAFEGTYNASTNKIATESTVTDAMGTLAFEGIYDASTNKIATESTVSDAVAALDGNLNNTTPGAGKTLTAFSQTDGVVSATFGDIAITNSQVSGLGTAATKGVVQIFTPASTSTNLPTASGVADFFNAYAQPKLLTTDDSIDIPEAGTSDIYLMGGLTPNHQVVLWNFSESAENNPPVSLTITTGVGQFTVTNNGGVSSETFRPVFSTCDTVTCVKQ